MAILFGNTFPIIKKRVGKGIGVSNDPIEITRINQLLRLAGFLKKGVALDSTWDAASATALGDFYSARKIMPFPPEYIDPKDAQDSLLALAQAAGVLIPLANGLRSASAILTLYDICRSNGYKYGWVDENKRVYNGGSHTIWGFENRPGYAISTTSPKDKKLFTATSPITLNCTSFANLMLSAWMGTTAHSGKYDASQIVGGSIALGSRYDLPAVNKGDVVDGHCYDADMLLSVEESNRIYHAAITDKNGNMTHDMVYYNGSTYECNIATPAVYKTDIKTKFAHGIKKGKHLRLFGPSVI